MNRPILHQSALVPPRPTTRILSVPRPQFVPMPSTVSADQAAFEQQLFERQHPTGDDRLVQSLIRSARTLNLTAAPPAHIKPTVWSDPIDLSATIVLPAAVDNTYQSVVSFTTPPGRWARIEHYGVNVVDPAAYAYGGNVLWGFRLNGRFLDQGMTDWGEQRGSMVFMRPVVINMINEGVTLDFMIKRPSAAGGEMTVQMGFRGWTYRLRNNYEGTQGSVSAY